MELVDEKGEKVEKPIYFNVQIQPVCSTKELEQVGISYALYDNASCTFTITVFIDCYITPGPTTVSGDDRPIQKDFVNALFIWLDLRLNQIILGICSLIIGLMFLFINYQGKSKKQRNLVINLVCIIVSVCIISLPFYLFLYNTDFNLAYGWIFIGAGFLAGQVFFLLCIKLSIRIFGFFIGFLSGFCFANTLEICLLFRNKYSYYIEYLISIGFFLILAQVFNFNIFNPLLSMCGAFFLVRGVIILWRNDQIAEIKQFLYEYGF